MIFAGWKSNGSGYQSWIAHGSGLYTTYNHITASISAGRHVSRMAGESAGSARPVEPPVPASSFEVCLRPDLERRVARQPLRYF